jgi:hypothetical protein
MSITVPQMVAVGQYDMSGQALVPLENSKGSYKTIFQDAEVKGDSKIKVRKQNTVAVKRQCHEILLPSLCFVFAAT